MRTALHAVNRGRNDAKPEGRLEQNPWPIRSSFGSQKVGSIARWVEKAAFYQKARRDDQLRRGSIAKVLLEHGADVDRDCGGGTPLRIAVPEAQFKVVKALFDWTPDDRGTTGGRGTARA